MFTDTFDPSQVNKVYVVQSQRKSSLNQNHKFEKKIQSILSFQEQNVIVVTKMKEEDVLLQ